MKVNAKQVLSISFIIIIIIIFWSFHAKFHNWFSFLYCHRQYTFLFQTRKELFNFWKQEELVHVSADNLILLCT